MIKNWLQWTKGSLFIALSILGFFLSSLPLAIISIAIGFLIFVERYLNIKIPMFFSYIFVGFIILSLILGGEYGFYYKFSWWDDMLHFFYGGAFAFIGYLVIEAFSRKRNLVNDPLLVCLFAVCFSVTGGVLWEIYEFAYDSIVTNGNMQKWIGAERGVEDTMHDLILETTSAIFTNIFIYLYLIGQQKNWVGRLSQEFFKLNKFGTDKKFHVRNLIFLRKKEKLESEKKY